MYSAQGIFQNIFQCIKVRTILYKIRYRKLVHKICRPFQWRPLWSILKMWCFFTSKSILFYNKSDQNFRLLILSDLSYENISFIFSLFFHFFAFLHSISRNLQSRECFEHTDSGRFEFYLKNWLERGNILLNEDFYDEDLFHNSVSVCLSICLFVWQTDRLTQYKSDRQMNRSILVCWSVSLLACQSIGLLVCLSVCLLVCWSVGLLFCWSVGLLACWSVCLSVSWSVGLLVCWSVGLLVRWSVGLLVCWSVGLLVCWSIGLLVCWSVGLLFCWSVGLLINQSVGLSGLLSVSISICWSVCLSVCWHINMLVCRTVRLSVCPSLYSSICPSASLSTCT
jgi:hypothetical protein